MNSTAANAGCECAGKIFAEGDPKVLIAYFLAFGIWTAAASNDFISSTWKSVRKTRQRGKLHVAFAFFPMIFIGVYVVFQHKARDYKEMGAAILALAFAGLHLSRTFMGLWQLHVFKQWAMESIESMESLGYFIIENEDETDSDDADEDHDGLLQWIFNVNDSDDADEDHDGLLQWLFKILKRTRKRLFPRKVQGRIEAFADKIRVNETLIDNRLSDVHTVCSFRLLSKEENVIVRNSNSRFQRLRLRYCYRFWNTLRVFRVLLSLVFLENPYVPNSISGPCLIPLRPESVWLNWATALVAQAGWMLQDTAHMDPSPSPGYKENRDQFAEQLLLSASLHTRRMSAARTSTSTSGQDKDKMSGILSFRDWHDYPELCEGKFSKQEWLKHACKTGNGLPYRMWHRKAKEGKDRWGYGNFKSELQRAREALPPELETRVEGFDVKMLEWFTIFVSVEDWASGSSSDERSARVDQNSENSSSGSSQKSRAEEKENEAENDIPVKNLKKQLGFTDDSSSILGLSKLPFLETVPKAFLWDNRNVLEISCHIDNWITLCAGEQTSYMLDRVPWMEHKLSLESAFRKRPTEGHLGSDDDYCSIQQVVEECAQFENCRYLCQMAIIQPNLCHFDKTLTFLGCSMEMLRSALAKSAKAYKNNDEGSWKPSLFSDGVLHTSNERLSLTRFDGTDDFTSCLRILKSVPDMCKRFVKMRVLWELQTYFHSYLQKNEVTPCSTEAIALCILSFPALSVKVRGKTDPPGVHMTVKETKESIEVFPGREECIVVVHDRGEQFRIEHYEYVIGSSCGPQDLQLILSFEASENSNVALSVALCEIEGRRVDYFDWEAWRNAFYGRLEGCRQWKEKVGIPNFPLIAPSEHINAGVQKVQSHTDATIPGSGAGGEMYVWKGWLPHFASICMYEITTEEFILQAREIQGGVPFAVTTTTDTSNILAIAQEVWEPVNYSDANPTSLKNASLVAHDLLCQGHVDVLSAQERVDVVLARKSYNASSSELRLLEVAAIQDRNTKALQKAIRVLMHNGENQQAVALLERFYVFAKHGSCNLYLFWRNTDYVKTVKSLFKEIFEISDYDRVVAERYRLFQLLLMRYGPEDLCDNTVSVVLQSILYRCHSMAVSEATESILSYFLSFHSSSDIEQVAVLVSAHSNAANEYDECSLEFLRQTADMCLEIAIRTLAKQTGGTDALEKLLASPYNTAELSKRLMERGSSNAISRLGGIVEEGGHGIDQNFPQAAELYIKAIEKDDHVGAVTRLAPLVKKAAPRLENEVSRVIGLYEHLIEDRGNRHAINVLADFFSSGKQEDVPGAMRLYERAISKYQDAHAMNMLGNLHTRDDKALKRDLPRAASLYCRAIYEGDHIYAMFNLAVLLYKGEIRGNIVWAVDLLYRSINEGGNFDAMNLLAELLIKGDGVLKDVPLAVNLFSRAIDDGNHTTAMYNFALLLCNGKGGAQRDMSRAVGLLNRSIEEGNNFDAMCKLAGLLAWGEEGLEKDIDLAKTLFWRAINEGNHSNSMLNLGVLLCSGDEVGEDVTHGVDLLSRSADDGGNVDAMNILAGMLEKGNNGVDKDIPRAVALYSRAVKEGKHPFAMYNLGVLLCGHEEGIERDLSRAADLFEQCISESGDVKAMIKLADLLETGWDGRARDIPRAIQFYELAATNFQSEEAKNKLVVLQSKQVEPLGSVNHQDPY